MKLASIEKIHKVTPIPGADKIELAHILGWQTIIRKGELTAGDICVWHNPDTIVDGTNPAYAFLAKSNYRLKPVKMKGHFSQGLALPITAFPALISADFVYEGEGQDVTELIKIVKYEKPIPACLAGQAAGNFPTHLLSITDEPLLRGNPNVVSELTTTKCHATLKLDGSSGTFGFHDGKFYVCSRRLELAETESNSFWRIARKYDLPNKLDKYGKSVFIQGELVGPGIQGNRLGLKEIDLYMFNVVFPTEGRRYGSRAEVELYAKSLGLKVVPIVWQEAALHDMLTSMDPLAKIQSAVNELKYPNGVAAEGIVIRPNIETHSSVLSGRLSVKVINENYKD